MATPPIFSSGAVLTAAQMNSVGLWLITQTSVVGAASLSISNCFTSDFTNYRIVWNCQDSSAATALNFRWRSGTTDLNGAFYYYGYNQNTSAATAFVGAGTQTSAQIATRDSNAFYPSNGSIEIANPLLGRVQGATFSYVEQNATVRSGQGGFSYSATSAGGWNGFSLLCASGTAVITAAVYGYRKA